MIVGTCEVKLQSVLKGRDDNLKIFMAFGDEGYSELQKEYVDRYGQIVDAAREKIKDWNDAWDDYYNGVMEEGDIMWNMYGQFFAANENMCCMVNNLINPESWIKMACISRAGEPKIIGIVDNDPDLYFETFFRVPKNA